MGTLIAQLECIAHAVATAHGHAVGTTPCIGLTVRVARFAKGDIDHAIAADLGGTAVCGATIAMEAVAVVAGLALVENAVAAACGKAHLLVASTARYASIAAVRALDFVCTGLELLRKDAALMGKIASHARWAHAPVRALGHALVETRARQGGKQPSNEQNEKVVRMTT